jgi:integrase
VDLELCLMSNLFGWAVLHGKVEVNPFTVRPKFRAKTIQHCREFMPQDAKELHALARVLMEDPRSEALGWQLLLEAMTGCRTNEILKLRWDAKNRYEAGFIEGDWLWLNRSKGGINPFVQIHPALKETLEAMRKWHQLRHPNSPWFFPGDKEGQPLSPASLTCALRRIAPLISKAKRTSHGLRAYYVTVRRSMGISDAQIAAEIGDKSGAAIIVHTYGAIPPNWYGAVKMDWMTDEPAWKVIGIPENITTLPKAACA